MTSTSSEVGISPVLLQAITHTLSSRAGGQRTAATSNTNPPAVIIQAPAGAPSSSAQHVIIQSPAAAKHPVPIKPKQFIKVEAPPSSRSSTVTAQSLLQGMNEPVVVHGGEDNVLYVQQGMEDTVVETVVEEEASNDAPTTWHVETATSSENDSQDSTPTPIMVTVGDGGTAMTQNGGDVNMSGVLTAIASHYKNSQNGETKHGVTTNGRVISIKAEQDKKTIKLQQAGAVVYPTAVPSPSASQQDLIVSEAVENIVTETVVTDNAEVLETYQDSSYMSPPPVKRPKVELADTTNVGTPPPAKPAPASQTIVIQKVADNTYIDATTGQAIEIQGLGGQLSMETGNTIVLRTVQGEGGGVRLTVEEHKPCPICGDKISGYHYGIYTCESCKGFFKRTVQNKKAFICHRKGDCEVNLANRKKCPACRFKRCLMSGMKLEAIREDRQRGGRSSYEGCSPHGRPPGSKPSTPRIPRVMSRPPPLSVNTSNLIKSVTDQVMAGGTTSTPAAAPRTPQLLEDLMAIETLMSEEEGEQSCCAGKLTPDDTEIFSSALHFADHCLYKIVRWARNLPDFANVSTDDQILLLQNCWGELLCICCCWHSMHAPPTQLKLCYGRSLTLHQAHSVGLGDITQRLIDFSQHLKRLEVDVHEFVAMKVLMLLTPDVKNLHDSKLIRVQQEKVSDALMIYTTTHFPTQPNKFAELLARLAELSRTCTQAKEVLRQRQAEGEVPHYSLLSELLKGDIVVQSG